MVYVDIAQHGARNLIRVGETDTHAIHSDVTTSPIQSASLR